ncbi:MAG TPA: hypothetical protein VK054_08020, partial [Beutenbergiaceae bacterium]|nr:hypothetical protein [Beutenbergiaceae bacterium]
TALYVTHDQDEAFEVADRIVLMRAGRLIQTGTPSQVWANPVDAQAAQFLGYRLVDNLALGPRALRVAATGTHQGTVVSVGVARGEIIAQVDIPGWGVQPVISRQHVRKGERVGVVVDDEQVRKFNRERYASTDSS